MRKWRVRRVLQPHPEGQRHWDRAYQRLLAWAEAPGAGVPSGPAPPAEEVIPSPGDQLGWMGLGHQ